MWANVLSKAACPTPSCTD